jgi:hypothetical protein
MIGCRACNREVPLVVIGASERAAAEPIAAFMRREGAVVLIVEGDGACLRTATALSPDIVLIDPRLSRGLLSLLRAHPFSRHAQISRSPALAMVASTTTNDASFHGKEIIGRYSKLIPSRFRARKMDEVC